MEIKLSGNEAIITLKIKINELSLFKETLNSTFYSKLVSCANDNTAKQYLFFTFYVFYYDFLQANTFIRLIREIEKTYLKNKLKLLKKLKQSKLSDNEIICNPRDYQLELVEKAYSKNFIVFLETGQGKTLISILLLNKLF